MSEYFNKPADLAPVTKARSTDINNLSQSVSAAFDKLPAELRLKTGTVTYSVDTGVVANAYVAAMSPKITSLVDGLEITLKPTRTNTASATLNVNNLGTIQVKRLNGMDAQPGDILTEVPLSLRYSASKNVFYLPAVTQKMYEETIESADDATAAAEAAAASEAAALASASAAAGLAAAASASANGAASAATAAIRNIYTTLGSSLLGFIQAGMGAVVRSVQDKLRETVSVFDFMSAEEVADVKSRTPVLDHTTAIQKGIDYARTHGVSCYLPSGEYRVSAALKLVLAGNNYLMGDGRNNTIIRTPVTSAASSVNLIEVTGDNVTISRIGMYGGRAAAADSKSIANEGRYAVIACSALVDGLNVLDCRVADCRGKGIYLRANNVIIERTHFNRIARYITSLTEMAGAISNWGSGDSLTNIRISHCTFNYIGQLATGLQRVTNLTIEGNTVEQGSGIGFGNERCIGLRIDANTIKHTANSGIDAQKCTHTRITHNRLYCAGSGTVRPEDAGMPDAFQAIYVGDDYIINTNMDSESENTIIEGNFIEGTFTSETIGGTEPAGYTFTGLGIALVGVNNVAVRGNTIKRMGRGYTTALLSANEEGVGIKAANSCYEVSIVGNKIYDCKGSGILLGVGNMSGILIDGNSVRKHGKHGIEANIPTRAEIITIVNNIIADGTNTQGAAVSADIYVALQSAWTALWRIDGNTCVNKARNSSANANATVYTTHGIYFDAIGSFYGLGNFSVKDNMLSGHSTAEMGFSSNISVGSKSRHYRAIDGNRVGYSDNTIGPLVNIPGLPDIAVHFQSAAAPASGSYVQGSIAWNPFPMPNNPIGWVCTISGTPGTWKAFGTISA